MVTWPWRLLAGVIAVAVIWRGYWGDLWLRWYPGFGVRNGSWLEGMTVGGSYYNHAIAGVLVALLAGWLIYRRVGWVGKRTSASDVAGWSAAAMFLAMHWFGRKVGVDFISAVALFGFICAMLVVTGGWVRLKAYSLAIGLLVFVLPVPMLWIDQFNFSLKITAADGAVWLANWLPGVKAEMDGSYLLLDGGRGGTLLIGDVCSGLKSLITLTWFAVLFAVICQMRGRWRWVMVVMALPVAVVSNMARIAVLVAGASWFSVEAVGDQTLVHQLIGLGTFVVALLCMLGFEKMVLFAGRVLKRDWYDPRLLGYLQKYGCHARDKQAFSNVQVVVLVLIAAGSLLTGENNRVVAGDVGGKAMPAGVWIDGQWYQGRDVNFVSSYDLGHVQRMQYSSGGEVVDVLVVNGMVDGGAIHPPEVCLKGSGFEIESQGDRQLRMNGGQVVTVRELITRGEGDGGRRRRHLFVYKAGDMMTGSYSWYRLQEILQRGQGDMRLIRVSGLIDGGNDQEIYNVIDRVMVRLVGQ